MYKIIISLFIFYLQIFSFCQDLTAVEDITTSTSFSAFKAVVQLTEVTANSFSFGVANLKQSHVINYTKAT